MIFKLGDGTVDLTITKVLNAGYAGCDQATVKAHIDELAAIGVSVPKRVPTFYPVPLMQLTTAGHIQVGHDKTSGEVEYVYIVSGGKAYFTVGCDHSDRALEAYSVPMCKQICPDIVGQEVWLFDEIKDHLDQIDLICHIWDKGEWRLYQQDPVTALLGPEKLLELGAAAIQGGEHEGLALYSGTIATIGEITYASGWRVTMHDKVLGRSITAEYTVERLPDSIE